MIETAALPFLKEYLTETVDRFKLIHNSNVQFKLNWMNETAALSRS